MAYIAEFVSKFKWCPGEENEQDIPAYSGHDSLIVPINALEVARNSLKNVWQLRGWSIRLK